MHSCAAESGTTSGNTCHLSAATAEERGCPSMGMTRLVVVTTGLAVDMGEASVVVV